MCMHISIFDDSKNEVVMKWSTTAMQVEMNDEGIIIVNPVEGFKGPETIVHAKENLASLDESLKDKLRGAIFFLPPYYVNTEATRYYGKNAPAIPVALVGDSFIKIMVGKFLLSLITAGRPIKIFSTFDEAMGWVQKKVLELESSKSA